MVKPEKPRARPAERTRSKAAGGRQQTEPSAAISVSRGRRKPQGQKPRPQARPERRTQSAAPALPGAGAGVRVNSRAAARLRQGHVWVYASDVEALEPAENGGGDPPALVPVADHRGLLLGTALYSPASQIVLRMVTRKAIGEAEWLELLAERLRRAIARRISMLDADNDACRLCFSEADELPGLVVDKYGPLVVVQRLMRGLLAHGTAEVCVRVLREELTPGTIVERPDPRIRELERLPAPAAAPLWSADEAAPATEAEFRVNGLRFRFDANAGQKTGAFLDQRTNYLAAREWARRLACGAGRALDVCCYQGGFALHLAEVCRQVTGIDASRASLEVAERNLAANRERIAGNVDWIEADAFEILRDWSETGERFDAIVLDPPAFAKTKRAVEGALRGYKELNLRALRMLRPGGLLVTCSCSHHVGWADFEAAVAAAAADAPRRVRLLERRGAAPDHPVVLNLPETEYLKCLVLEVQGARNRE